VSKRTPLRLDAMREEGVAPSPVPLPPSAPALPLSAGPEPTTTVYARVPWALGEGLRDLARQRSRTEGRRVTVNDLVVEALHRLLGSAS
jgi:hypothetical protein